MITHNEKTTKKSSVYVKTGAYSYSTISWYYHLPGADNENKKWLDSEYTNAQIGELVTEVYVLCIYLKIKNSYSGILGRVT
jgi:hypothetical protein